MLFPFSGGSGCPGRSWRSKPKGSFCQQELCCSLQKTYRTSRRDIPHPAASPSLFGNPHGKAFRAHEHPRQPKAARIPHCCCSAPGCGSPCPWGHLWLLPGVPELTRPWLKQSWTGWKGSGLQCGGWKALRAGSGGASCRQESISCSKYPGLSSQDRQLENCQDGQQLGTAGMDSASKGSRRERKAEGSELIRVCLHKGQVVPQARFQRSPVLSYPVNLDIKKARKL